MPDHEREQPLLFADYMDAALYGPAGFYHSHGHAGTSRGDFVTSVEVGPLFGAVIARWLDQEWRDVGRPSRFRVVEAGAGVGTLYRSVLRAKPDCVDSLDYTLVERSDRLRSTHGELPGFVASLAELPNEPCHVVMANELLDNLAFDIAERFDDGWRLLGVETGGTDAPRLVPTGLPAPELLAAVDIRAVVGSRVPVAVQAHQWIEHARALSGRVLAFDYGATTQELADRGIGAWLRTYADHERGSDPFASLGTHDITCDVPVDQLPHPVRVETQAEWLARNGIAELVSHAREVWRTRAHIGDLAAIAARSAVNEAQALTDPAGLGGFLVLEW